MRYDDLRSELPRAAPQFGLKAIFLATAFIGLELGIIRWLGQLAIPLCTELAVCAGLLAWTSGRGSRGALSGLFLGVVAGGLIALSADPIMASDFFLLFATLAVFGSWIGCSIQAAGAGFFCGLIALWGASCWLLALMWWAARFFR